MSKYRLYSWGANSHGQLGQGELGEEELPIPEEVELRPGGPRPEKIRKIVGGAGHSLILDDEGAVYSCGWNVKGQAGDPGAGSRFQRLLDFDGQRIVEIACGWDSAAALAEAGDLYVWGSNSHGQLGAGPIGVAAGAKLTRPTKLPLGAPVVGVAMGLRHTALVTGDSRLYVSGAATKGQLGLDVRGARLSDTFLEVINLQPVKRISCGQNFTVAITVNNEVFAWGDNKHGQLGMDPSLFEQISTPKKIENIVGCKQIYCGWTHSIMLTDDKKVLCWGRNSYGQLGRSDCTPKSEAWKPDCLFTSKKINQLSVGSEHNVALTDAGNVLSWGWNEHGNCGNGTKTDVFVPCEVKLPEGSAILIGSGAGHSFAVVKTNN